ncbi:unnamed protein product [Lepeophtheirus salmonis]|uniref:(salmon louse) hypothetical protein n=1 Tax=Lepeophtheirus salmonis TaxID=72036 RepID=A0A7R8H545_LEPSM|nr:unnamed protein product [Lepeophtheirus salmonis]CAF2874374.1 unnamed protein product [Lepeophtheirus salmonis]
MSGILSGYIGLRSSQNGPNSCISKPKLSFHLFPKNDDLRKKWIRVIRREVFVLTKHSRVCSRHFHDSWYQLEKNDKNVTRLKNNTNTSKGMRLTKLNPNTVPRYFLVFQLCCKSYLKRKDKWDGGP